MNLPPSVFETQPCGRAANKSLILNVLLFRCLALSPALGVFGLLPLGVLEVVVGLEVLFEGGPLDDEELGNGVMKHSTCGEVVRRLISASSGGGFPTTTVMAPLVDWLK